MLTSRRRNSTRCLTVLILGLAVTDVDPAWAQPPLDAAPASAEALDRAKRRLRDGNEAYRNGDFAAAELAYRQAYLLRPAYDTAGNLGQALLKLGEHAEAAKYLAECVRGLPATAPDGLRKRVFDAFEAAKKEVGAIQVMVNVVGAEVVIDGNAVGRAPIVGETYVAPGQHVIQARAGSDMASQEITVGKGSSRTVSLSIDTGPNIAVIIAGGAAGLVGVGMGVTFAILSNGKAGDTEALPVGNPERVDLRDEQTVLGNVSLWSFVGGGLALAGTAVYALTSGLGGTSETPSTGLRATPVVTAGGGGVIVVGRW